jgi:hypothetical protein
MNHQRFKTSTIVMNGMYYILQKELSSNAMIPWETSYIIYALRKPGKHIDVGTNLIRSGSALISWRMMALGTIRYLLVLRLTVVFGHLQASM